MIADPPSPTFLDTWLKESPQLPGLVVAGICILILLIVTLPRLRSWLRGRGRPVLDPVQAEELIMGPGALVVDLRDPKTFHTGHIRGCLHVPFGDLATHLLRPDPAAKRALILVDETDLLAHQAFDLLTARGFTWMYVMKGGMHAWKRANQPLTK